MQLPVIRCVQFLCTAALGSGPVKSPQHHQLDLEEDYESFHTEGHYDNRLFSTVRLSDGKKIKRNHPKISRLFILTTTGKVQIQYHKTKAK